MDKNKKIGIIFYGISIFIHVLFFSSLMFFQNFQIPKPLPPVIQIDLVSFAPDDLQVKETANEHDTTQKEGIPVKVKALKKIRKISTIKPDISLKTKPKNLKDLMAQKKKKELEKKKEKKPLKKEKPKKEIDPSKALEEARQKLEKAVENQTRDKIAQALSRLQGKVKEQGKIKENENKRSNAGYGKKGYTPIDLYKMVLGSAIEQNWVFNDIFARMDQNLEVRILIKILKSGEIRDIIYETRSGNRYLDESAKKAIKKASPLPALPSGMYSYDLLIGFTPKGLK